MKVGDIVTVYCDPITEKEPEGKAKLLRRIPRRLPYLFTSWEVLFEGEDDQAVERIIFDNPNPGEEQ